MPTFTGKLNPNEIYSSLYNMLIGQTVFNDRLNVTDSLVSKARIDGSAYGDTKLYYATNVLHSRKWGADAEAPNLLATHRPSDPKTQAITLSEMRIIELTLDSFLSKRAWFDSGIFGEFTSVMEGTMGKTKDIYDDTTYNAFFGTHEVDGETFTCTITDATKEAEEIAQYVANLVDDMCTLRRNMNAYGQATKFHKDQIHIVWNKKIVNKIKLVDLPAIFHKEGLLPEGETLHADYFGKVNTDATAGDGKTVRYMSETKYGTGAEDYAFAGELVPVGVTADAGNSYTTDDNIICKIYVKLPPYMSGLQAGDSFWNPIAQITNRYLIWGHNPLESLDAYPFITIKKA
jgi:hypothetical protein